MKKDVLVLGAGAVGVATAVRLQARGLDVALVDRGEPGLGTSFGNAGLIQSDTVYPYRVPQDLRTLLRYALNRTTAMHYHLGAMPNLAPFLSRYARQSREAAYQAMARQYATLMAHAVPETIALAREAGAEDLLRHDGWLRVFRTARIMEQHAVAAEHLRTEFGIGSRLLDAVDLRRLEPSLLGPLAGALHLHETSRLTDPGAFVGRCARHFKALGGTFVTGDALTLKQGDSGWSVETEEGSVSAGRSVLCLGPWADLVTRPLGYQLRLAVKRGYHMHYATQVGAVLNRPVVDFETGYLLAPMVQGIRLTTGIEFALRDARRTPVQLSRAEPVARSFFPLGARLDGQPWMGMRPCTADMMPVIGPAPRHPGLWFAFGHAHHGLTLAAVTGRMIADMVAGEEPFVDARPFAADRPSLN